MEKLLKQNKLINRTGCRLLFAMRIGKIILYIVCSMYMYIMLWTMEAKIQLLLIEDSSISSLIRSWLESGKASGQKLARMAHGWTTAWKLVVHPWVSHYCLLATFLLVDNLIFAKCHRRFGCLPW